MGAGRVLLDRAAWRSGLRLLRRPWVVIAEVAGIAAAGATIALLPQAPDAEEIAQFGERLPALARVTEALGLHAVATSAGFLGLVALSLASLLVVQRDQWRRLRRAWRDRPGPDAFERAQFRRELPLAACRAVPDRPVLAGEGRAGLLGSPIFHLGLVLVVAAGLWRLLTFSDALVRVFEGETLAADPLGYEVQRAGRAARPFALTVPVRVEAVVPSWYPSGALRQLEARVSLLGAAGGAARLAVNTPLDVGEERLYLTQRWGLAALVEHRVGSSVERRAVFLDADGSVARGKLELAAGAEARLKAQVGAGRPSSIELRVVRQNALRGITAISPDAEVQLAPDESLRLVGLPYWVQLRGSRDPTSGLFFTGVAIAVLGVALMFTFVRVDTGVFVEGDRLVVALRAQRFAPLFAERFDRLVREWSR